MAGPQARARPSRRLTIAIGASVVALLLWFGIFHSSAITNAPPRNDTIVAFGDSLTAGTGASPGMDYPAQLSRLMGVPIVNRGVSGDTTADALARIERDVLALHPGIVIVILGGNDFLRHVDAAVAERNLAEIIERLQAEGAVVVLGEIRGVFPMGDYGTLYRRLARKYGAVLVPDILNDILTRPSRKSDPIHPNDEGYGIIAQRIAAAIKPLLEQARAGRGAQGTEEK